MKTHKHYDTAARAYYNTSHSPEKRAEGEIKYFDATYNELKELGCSVEGLEKFERLFLLSLQAKSRCISSMITGPANFPVARAEKANARERKISDELLNYVERVKKAIDKQNNPTKYAISSDNENALDLLKQKLNGLKKSQEIMKACNKIIKSKASNKLEQLIKLLGSEDKAQEIMKPDCFGCVGFASFSLSNNNANIKATEQRIKQLETAANRVTRELTIAGVRVKENAEENRLQFFFEGKPSQEIINLMKSHGFKWTPSQNCWQRLWNNNAIFTVNHYITPKLKELNQTTGV